MLFTAVSLTHTPARDALALFGDGSPEKLHTPWSTGPGERAPISNPASTTSLSLPGMTLLGRKGRKCSPPAAEAAGYPSGAAASGWPDSLHSRQHGVGWREHLGWSDL